MSLEDEVRDRFLSDTQTILKGHLDDLEGMFQLHEDGTIEVLDKYRGLSPPDRILIHLIARRYQVEGGMADDSAMPNDELYRVFSDKGKSTVRGYLSQLRENGFARSVEGGNEVIVERLPEAIERIETEASG